MSDSFWGDSSLVFVLYCTLCLIGGVVFGYYAPGDIRVNGAQVRRKLRSWWDASLRALYRGLSRVLVAICLPIFHRVERHKPPFKGKRYKVELIKHLYSVRMYGSLRLKAKVELPRSATVSVVTEVMRQAARNARLPETIWSPSTSDPTSVFYCVECKRRSNRYHPRAFCAWKRIPQCPICVQSREHYLKKPLRPDIYVKLYYFVLSAETGRRGHA